MFTDRDQMVAFLPMFIEAALISMITCGTAKEQDWEEYLRHPNWKIRIAVAQSEHAPIHIIQQILEDDEFANLRPYLVDNPKCPHSKMMQFAKNGSTHERNRLAKNPGITPEVAAALITDDNAEVRSSVIKNPALPDYLRVIQHL